MMLEIGSEACQWVEFLGTIGAAPTFFVVYQSGIWRFGFG
jgi:hypothetical protein